MWSIFIDKLPDIAIGFMIPFISWIFKNIIFDKLSERLFIANAPFELNGVWIVSHGVYYNPNLNIIEILKIKQHKEKLEIKIEQYKSDKKEVRFFYGLGVVKSNFISLFYAVKKSDLKSTGTIILEVTTNESDTYLSGFYFELCDDNEKYQIEYTSNEYKAKRIKLTGIKKIKSMLNFKIFKNYQCAYNYINEQEN